MSGFKFYNWSVELDDGSRYSYEFQLHEMDPWTEALRKFGRFLEGEGHYGVADKIEDICEEFEAQLDGRIASEKALTDYLNELDKKRDSEG
jgi:hypothetical protein